MVSESPAKDIVPRVRCTENTSDSTEKRIKTTPKHIRFSPPMSNGTPELRKPVELQCGPLQKNVGFLGTTTITNKNRENVFANIPSIFNTNVYEFNEVSASPLYTSTDKRKGLQPQVSDNDENNDDRWQLARSIGPTQNSQIMTRKTYGRYNDGSVSYQETIMTQVRDTVKKDIDGVSQKSSPSMSVAELQIKHYYKTPPQKVYDYQDNWHDSHCKLKAPAELVSTYSETTNMQINDTNKDPLPERKLRSSNRDKNNTTAAKMMYIQAVKKPKRRKKYP